MVGQSHLWSTLQDSSKSKPQCMAHYTRTLAPEFENKTLVLDHQFSSNAEHDIGRFGKYINVY